MDHGTAPRDPGRKARGGGGGATTGDGRVIPGFPWRLVTVDIDGTLTRTHGWREIAVAFDRLPDFERSNRLFHAHQIDEDTHLVDFLRIAEGHLLVELEGVLERTPKLAGISEGVAALRASGASVALLSHNPVYVVDWYRHRFGFDDGEGVAGQPVEQGRIGAPAGIHADKPASLGRLLARHPVPTSRVAHVGDGWSDAELFRRVGAGIAVNAASREVEQEADLALRTSDFWDVVEGLQRLVPSD